MISIVIPIYNEAPILDELVSRVVTAMGGVNDSYEIVLVDDGSMDNSLSRIKELQKKNPQLKCLVLSRNFGHQAALTAGLHHAKGDWVILMDGDLQDPPELIPALIEKQKLETSDLVTAKRYNRNGKKRQSIPNKLFHILFKRVSYLQDIEDAGHFCLLSRKVVTAILSLHEKQRYLPGMRSYVGFKNAYINYEREAREQGASKMNTLNLLQLSLDAIFAFSALPVRLCFTIGLIGTLTGVVALLHTLLSNIFDWAPLGWSSTYLSIYFFGALQLMVLGIIGEYVYRIYKEIQNRPSYFIREEI